MLTSGTVLNKVVEKLKLAEDSEFNGQRQGGIGNIFSSLRALLSMRQRAGGDAGDRRRALAVGNLAESLSVERGGKTFVVSIGATTEEPEKSALIANTLIEVFFKAYGELQSEHCRPRHRRIAVQARRAARRPRRGRAQGREIPGRARSRRCAGQADLRRRAGQAQRAAVDRPRPHDRAQRACPVDPVDQRRRGARRRAAGGARLDRDVASCARNMRR